MSLLVGVGIATPIVALSTLKIIKERRLRRKRELRRNKRDAEMRQRMGLER